MKSQIAALRDEGIRKSALRYMFKPLVRFCMRSAISLQEVIDQLKLVFVEVACEELSRAGIKKNPNRISLMSGVHRRDVSAILEKGDEYCEHGISTISKVLGAWEQDPRFSSRGKPRELEFEGAKNSFTDLVHSVSRHLHPRSVLDELLRSETVSRQGSRIRLDFAVSHVGLDPLRRFRFLGRNVATLVAAAEQNFTAEVAPPNLHVRTEYDNVPTSKVPEIRRWFLEEGKLFHKRARDFVAQFDADLNPESSYEREAGASRVVIASFSYTTDHTETIEEQKLSGTIGGGPAR